MSGFSSLVTFLPVASLESAHHFYSEVLGLELELDQGSCRIYRVAPGACVGICAHLDARPGAVITTLVTHEVDAWYARLVAAGVVPDHAPTRNDQFGIYHFFVTDPAGNRLEIQRFETQGTKPAVPPRRGLP